MVLPYQTLNLLQEVNKIVSSHIEVLNPHLKYILIKITFRSKAEQFRPKRIRDRTTQAYALLYGTEINVTEDDQIKMMLEILRRTRPVENYYRYVFDYKRRYY